MKNLYYQLLYLGRASCSYTAETIGDVFSGVAVDTPVECVRHAEKLMPLAAVGEAVAEENDRR